MGISLSPTARDLIRSTRKIWNAMISRCHNAKDISFNKYGARGAVVCSRWRASFEAFLADVGVRPPGVNGKRGAYTLDRFPNRDGNYEPGNVRWVTWSEQQSNRRNNRLLTYNGETLTVAGWAKRTGLTRQGLRYRLERGWSVEDALTKPMHMGAPADSLARQEDA